MGHARAYVTFDIIRRILEDYFGYNVDLVMNVTDIDDKIILRARRNFLFDQFVTELKGKSVDEAIHLVTDRANAAFEHQNSELSLKKTALSAKLDSSLKKRQAKALQEQISGLQVKLSNLVREQDNFIQALAKSPTSIEDVENIAFQAKDAIAQSLDEEKGSLVTDLSIFKSHSQKYEQEFLQDMDSLHVRPPQVLTRVSEYVPEIISFVDKIVAKGLAYVSDGSVYFDTLKFIACGHDYAKLSPWAVGDLDLVSEGEGALASIEGKRNPQDFALWKRSRDGEPFWDSPWGPGRPGWHIECSAMASALLGDNFDIHSGGEDLRFPHHDNELAQSEAFFGCKQWVNYFLHAGHLHIEGKKMSKSLKNFVTIREALEKHSARQIRILFLLQGWEKTINFAHAALDEAQSKEKRLKEFFLEIETRRRKGFMDEQKWDDIDIQFEAFIESSEDRVHSALSDSFDYPLAFHCVFDLISETNKYITNSSNVKLLLLEKSAQFVQKMIRVFGLLEDTTGFSGSEVSSDSAKVTPLLDAFTGFRARIREFAKLAGNTDILNECDMFRDSVLPELGVRLEDVAQGSVWKLVDPEELRAERHAKEIGLIRKKLNAKQKELALFKQYSEDPFKMFQGYNVDDQGIPTHEVDGTEVSKKARKKLEARFAKQKKNFAKHEEREASEPGYMKTLEQEISQLEDEISA